MSDTETDKRAAQILRAWNNADVPFLVRMLSDPKLRYLAARCLGEVGATEAIPKIAPLLYANDPLARSTAARALGVLGSLDALPRVAELAEHDPVPFVRGTAVTAFGRLGGRAAVPRLVEFLHDSEWRVRVGSAFALGLIGDKDAAAAVREARRREGLLHQFRRRAFTNALQAIEQARDKDLAAET
jgi:HEAT repeat protein